MHININTSKINTQELMETYKQIDRTHTTMYIKDVGTPCDLSTGEDISLRAGFHGNLYNETSAENLLTASTALECCQ